MSSPITTFRHVRARVHRLGTDTWLSAWTTHLGADAARFRLPTFVGLRPGEAVRVECYGDGAMVRFQGVISGQAGQTFGVSISGALAFEPCQEEVRLCIEGIEGEVWSEDASGSLVVLDLSPGSLGGLSDQSFGWGAVVGVALRTPFGAFQGEGTVANCRPEPSQEGYHRVGVRLIGASRLDVALWSRLLREVAEG